MAETRGVIGEIGRRNSPFNVVVKRAVIVLFGMLAALVAALATFGWYSDLSVRADHREQVRGLSGDELIPNSVGSVTHAVTIRRPPHEVWPWLAQMGSGRAGWYAYDFIDNGGQPSADRILPEFQNVGVSTVFPALPEAKDVFVAVRCEPEYALVLAWRSPNGTYLTTWAFVLEQPAPNRTRLIVRGRAAPDYSPYGLPLWFTKLTAPWVHAIMERKQLRGIQRRAEAAP
ncbi:MAG: SRPBCC family protein [Candidatus Acidiferrales bacterium]